MDTKVKIKEEEDPFSDDLTSESEMVLFISNDAMKRNSDTVLLSNVCDRAIKAETKSETTFRDLCLQKERECVTKRHTEQIKPETVTCSNYEIDTNTEFLLKDPLMKTKEHNSNHEMDDKIETVEEPWWLNVEAASVCDNIKDVNFTPTRTPRLHSEAVSGDSCCDSPLPSAEATRKITSCNYGNNSSDCESQEGDVTKISPVETHVASEQSGECSGQGEIYCRSILTHKGEAVHKCEICEKRFTSLPYFKLHTLIHEGKEPHKCKVCEKRFTQLSHLKRHNLIHEGKKPYKCEICEKSFNQLSNLKSHSFIHGGKRPHKCSICETSFTRLSDLKRHKYVHEGKKPHKCEICDKGFTSLSYLKLHNLIHEGKKPYKCEICEKSFINLSYLISHNLSHEGKKPHKCDTCGKSFTHLSYLKSHNLIHEGKRPHKCEICEKRFTQLSNLRKHNLIHEGKRPHKCNICDKKFIRLSHLKSHILTHEGKMPHN